MRTGRPKAPMILSLQKQEQLKGIVSSHSLPSSVVRRGDLVTEL